MAECPEYTIGELLFSQIADPRGLVTDLPLSDIAQRALKSEAIISDLIYLLWQDWKGIKPYWTPDFDPSQALKHVSPQDISLFKSSLIKNVGCLKSVTKIWERSQFGLKAEHQLFQMSASYASVALERMSKSFT